MTDQSIADSFEQRFAAELERYVAGAFDAKPASEIAAVAMRPRGISQRAKNMARPRRLLLLGLAAAFLVPAVYFGAMSLRPPAPDVINQVQPPRTLEPQQTEAPGSPEPAGYLSVFVRRDEGSDPGVSIFAVRPDGAEQLLRKVPDSFLPSGSTIGQWGTASDSGWLALGAEKQGGPWPMVLIDLSDATSEPWVIDEANLGGIGPAWGPTGLVAAQGVVVDPDAHTLRQMPVPAVGGGPTILWTADGRGLLGQTESGSYQTVPIDGGTPIEGMPELDDPPAWLDPRGDIRICTADAACAEGEIGSVQRVAVDGSSTTIFRQSGPDRVLDARYADDGDKYLLLVDHNAGRQVQVVLVQRDRQDVLATVDRRSDWSYVGLGELAPDGSVLTLWLDLGGIYASDMVLLNGDPSTLVNGHYAGMVEAANLDLTSDDPYVRPAQSQPPIGGEAYQLPTLDELIEAETNLNPGRIVFGKGARDRVVGETGRQDYSVVADTGGGVEVYLDCIGPSPVTVSFGSTTITSDCLRAGSYSFSQRVTAGDAITVSATGDTSWRVVIYAQYQS